MLFQYLVPNFTLFSITLGATVPRGISPPVVDRFQRDLVGFTDHLQDDHPVKRDVTDAIASKFEGTSVRRRGITTNNADFGIPLTCAPKTFIRGEMIESWCFDDLDPSICSHTCKPFNVEGMAFYFNCVIATGGATSLWSSGPPDKYGFRYNYTKGDSQARLDRWFRECPKYLDAEKTALLESVQQKYQNIVATVTASGIYTATSSQPIWQNYRVWQSDASSYRAAHPSSSRSA